MEKGFFFLPGIDVFLRIQCFGVFFWQLYIGCPVYGFSSVCHILLSVVQLLATGSQASVAGCDNC
jgi:hypothetical protein